MKITATLNWNPETVFDQANSIDVNVQVDENIFQGKLKSDTSAIDYLRIVFMHTKGRELVRIERIPYKENKGERIYSVQVRPEDEYEVIANMNKSFDKYLNKLYYILPRNEFVNDEEWCKFYGCAGIWSHKKCEYPEGGFIETLRQTVYDMKHVQDNIHTWTNVPVMEKLDKLRKEYSDFNRFVENKIKPLSLLDFETDEEYIKNFIKIVDLTEEYAKSHNIEIR